MRKRFFILFIPLIFLQINKIFSQIVITNEGRLIIKDNQLFYVDGHFVNKSTFFKNQGDFTLTGNFWNEAKVSNPGYGILRFVGGQNQTVFLFDSLAVFDMEIDNPDGLTLTGGNDLFLFGEMNFQDGIVYTQTNNLLAFQSGSSHFNANDFSHIDGPTTKRGIEDFEFPIGKGGLLRPSGIENLTDTTTFLSEYFNYSYFDLNTDATLYRVSNEEFWDVERISGSSDASVLLTYEDGIGGFSELEDIRMAYFDNPWTRIESTYSGAAPAIFVSNNRLSKFGKFTFAENSLNQPSITLEIYQDEDCGTHLNWVLPPESRVESFDIEVSLDSTNYTRVGTIAGDTIPNSTFKLYEYVDYELYDEELLFYRIKINQPGGSFYYTATIRLENKCIFTNCSIFPNPVRSTENIKLSMTSEFDQTLNLRVYDVPGRVLLEQEINVLAGNHIYPVETAELDLASGMYFLEVTPRKSLKFVVIYD